MKLFKYLLALALLTFTAYAQGTSADCVLNFTLTAAGNSATFDNRGKLCTAWVLTYTNVGHSALTLTIDAAPTTSGGTAGSWGTATGTFTGTHPATTTTHSTVRLEAFHPFLRVNLSGLTGTGTVSGRLYGYRYAASRVVGSSGGTSASATAPYLTLGASAFGPLYAVTDPAAPSWAWVNQGTATLTVTNGVQTLCTPNTNGSVSVNMRMVSAPPAPYTVTALVALLSSSTSTPRTGLAFRESGTGKVVTVGGRDGTNLTVETWTNATSYSGTPFNRDYGSANGLKFIRIQNTGSNLLYEISSDGFVFYTLLSTTLTTFFTTEPDQIGFFAMNNASTSDLTCTSLFSWLVS